MLRQVRAAAPRLLKLALLSKQASQFVEGASTSFQKRAHVVELDGINHQLVAEAIKLGSGVMGSLKKNQKLKAVEELKGKAKDGELEKINGLSIPKALGLGAGIAAVPTLAANYTLGKASDEMDSKMWAMPGLAAATVGAILAARSGNATTPASEESVAELENALNAKEVLDSAASGSGDAELTEELAKMSSVSTDHIASLLVELLS
tara:strand:+ start:885 stop:1505 length:621 start_codon:yes stop_codon:yes gene_type:complete